MLSFSDVNTFLSPLLPYVALAVAIGVAIWREISHRRSLKEKLPFYAIRSDNIIRDLSSRFERLQVLYDGKSIRDFTATRFVFWNGGREPILRKDVPLTNPIGIRVKEGCSILDARRLQHNNDDSQFAVSLTDDPLRVKCEFEFIAQGQGLVMQVLHTGKSGDDVTVQGTVVGPGVPKRRFVFVSPSERTRLQQRLAIFVMGILGYLGILYFMPGMFPLSLMAIVIFVLALVLDLSDLREKRLPKGLEAFEGA